MNRFVMMIIWSLPLLAGIFTYGDLPEQMAVHFNSEGIADGFQSKPLFFVIYVVISSVIMGALLFTRKLDPKKQNYEKFPKAYEAIRFAVLILLSVSYLFLVMNNLGVSLDVRIFVHLLLGLVWVIVGNYLGQVRSNHFIGIRTPWTMADEGIWRKTHRMAAPVWVLAGLLLILAAFLPALRESPILVLSVIIVSIALPIVYSFILHRRMQR
ncbi:SdpI family protein [Brevibacillus migulae]|uniref:SdpI family protein n=1 Tax=Brevibacillus migulae TaxID=1644114 RepID=UPI00106E7B13|nr:SdpI family protein [Brevibacillus migulae]